MADLDIDKITKYIKSVLTSQGGQTDLRQLADDYRTLMGHEIPFRKFNHPSLLSLLRSMKKDVMVMDHGGIVIVKVIAGEDQGLNVIARMVNEQDNRRKKKMPHRRSRPPVWGSSMHRGNTRGRRPQYNANALCNRTTASAYVQYSYASRSSASSFHPQFNPKIVCMDPRMKQIINLHLGSNSVRANLSVCPIQAFQSPLIRHVQPQIPPVRPIHFPLASQSAFEPYKPNIQDQLQAAINIPLNQPPSLNNFQDYQVKKDKGVSTTCTKIGKQATSTRSPLLATPPRMPAPPQAQQMRQPYQSQALLARQPYQPQAPPTWQLPPLQGLLARQPQSQAPPARPPQSQAPPARPPQSQAPPARPPQSQASPTIQPPKLQATPTTQPPKLQGTPTTQPPKSQATPTTQPPKSQATPTTQPPKSQAIQITQPPKSQASTTQPPQSRASPASQTFPSQAVLVRNLKQELEEEVRKKLPYDGVRFKIMDYGQKTKYFVATVDIGPLSASSYPHECTTPDEAMKFAIETALELLRQYPESFPTTDSPDVYIPRVKQLVLTIVADRGHVWCTHVEKVYQEAHEELLPEGWVEQIKLKMNEFGLKVEKLAGSSYALSIVSRPPSPLNLLNVHVEPSNLLNIHAESQAKERCCSPSDTDYAADDDRSDGNKSPDEDPRSGPVAKDQPHCEQNGTTVKKPSSGNKWSVDTEDTNDEPLSLPAVKEPQNDTNGCTAVDEPQSELDNLPAVSEEAEATDKILSSRLNRYEGGPGLPPLVLPPEPFWDVFVMYIEDTTNINLRFIGPEYSEAYDDLLTNLELHYMEDKNLNPVESPKVGEIYVAFHEESWFRVRLLQIDGNMANVLFIDHGDTEMLEISDIHHIRDEFCTLPAQCIRCCLSGLENVCNDTSAQALLLDMALGQTLVAEVVRECPDICGVPEDCLKPQPIVLYNTNGEDDININEKIAEDLAAKGVPEPTLPTVGGIAEVYMKYVRANGDIFVEVNSSTSLILDNMLHLARLRTREFLGEGEELDMTRLYLAQFSHDGEWYRATPMGSPENGKVSMYYVDFGNRDNVPLCHIQPLEDASSWHHRILSKTPHQALRCRLNNVPGTSDLKWTHRASLRLNELTEDSLLMLKVVQEMEDDKPPLVDLFKRHMPQNELISINATLSLDTTLFSDGDTNNNDVDKVIMSPTRSRSRQSSCDSLQDQASGLSMNAPVSPPVSPNREETDIVHKIPSPEVPPVGDYYDVVISFAASPSNFAVQSFKTAPRLIKLSAKMQKHYEVVENSGSSKPIKIKPGNHYAVMHSDNEWYRALVDRVDQDMVAGRFVDYGDCFFTTYNKVQPLDPSFCKLPCQAIKAKLHLIDAPNKDWTTDGTRRFQDLVENKEMVSAVMAVTETYDQGTVLSLILVDTSEPDVDVLTHEVLVNEGHAISEPLRGHGINE